jgi:hypothetical protein
MFERPLTVCTGPIAAGAPFPIVPPASGRIEAVLFLPDAVTGGSTGVISVEGARP